MLKKLLLCAALLALNAFAYAQEPPAPPAPPAPAPAPTPAPAPAPAPTPAPAPAPAPTPAPAPSPAPAPGDKKTVLARLGKGEKPEDDDPPAPPADTPEARALAAAEKDTRRPKEVPAKYWDAEKGEVNYTAWAKSTTELETRMRAYGLPPKEASEYKFEVPKELKEAGVDLEPTQTKAFQGKAHELGLTQKQYEGVMGAYFEQLGTLADQTKAFSEQKCMAALKEHYKTDEAVAENVKLAFNAYSAYADDKEMEEINAVGNIPAVIRVLAKIGKELKEDPGVKPDAILDGESLETLMRGKPGDEDAPYWNASDPRHKATVAKVMAHHEAVARSRQRKAA